MRNKELEGKLRRAYSHAAPDVLDSVLSSCEDTKDKVIVMTEQKKRPASGCTASTALSPPPSPWTSIPVSKSRSIRRIGCCG